MKLTYSFEFREDKQINEKNNNKINKQKSSV